MNENQRRALLWAIRVSNPSDFTEEERAWLASAQQKLEVQQPPSPAEHRVLADAALCAGTLLVAGFAGLDIEELPGPHPTLEDLETAQAHCEAHCLALAAV